MNPIDKIKFVDAIEPQAGAAIAGNWISLKNVLKVLVVVQIAQGAANTVAITIEKAPLVDGASNVAIDVVVPIWSNLDSAASDDFVKRTNAVNYTTDAGVKNKIVVFEIDPSILGAGYAAINVNTGASNASNITSAHYLCELRESGADLDAD